MVKLGFLGALIAFASPVGIWIGTDGTEREAPCPEIAEEAPQRLPRGCEAPRAGVLIAPHVYVEMIGDLAELRAERDRLKLAVDQERGAYQELMSEYERALKAHELNLNILQSACTPVECPSLKPAMIGAAISATACASVIATYQFVK